MALNKKDLEIIDELLGKRIAENNAILIDLFDDKFNDLRSEMINEMHNIIDPVMKEIKTSREEQTTMSGQIRDHEDRIAELEKSPALIQ